MGDGARECLQRALTGKDIRPTPEQPGLLGRGQFAVVLQRIGDSKQQVGHCDRIPQWIRQLLDREGEGPAHLAQHLDVKVHSLHPLRQVSPLA